MSVWQYISQCQKVGGGGAIIRGGAIFGGNTVHIFIFKAIQYDNLKYVSYV